MGLFTKICDKIDKTNTIDVSVDELVKIAKAAFIDGANEAGLKKLLKTVRGGSKFIPSQKMTSADEKYYMYVGTSTFDIILPWKMTFILENDTRNLYQIKERDWSKFRKKIKEAVAEARGKKA